MVTLNAVCAIISLHYIARSSNIRANEAHERGPINACYCFDEETFMEVSLMCSNYNLQVLYLLDPGPGRRKDDRLLSDNHWRHQNQLCHPCYVRYDFIGHYETLVEDALFVLHRLGVDDRVQFPNDDPDNRWKKRTAEVAASIISEISPIELNRVRDLYRTDFELFGYDNRTVSGGDGSD